MERKEVAEIRLEERGFQTFTLLKYEQRTLREQLP